LERLAKLFSDQDQAKEGPKDPISVNTQDLKYYSYGLQILNKIETVWKYPEEAGRAGIGGEVVVDMMIGRDGKLADLLLVQSSGYSVLDDEVYRAVRRAAPYAPLPAGLSENPFPMTIHFLYIAQNHYLLPLRTR
jgi:protein TonB